MMAARRDDKSPTPAPAPAAPPYYIAERPLYIGGQFGRAFNPGDQVPVEHVEKYGWQTKVRLPDGYAAPDQPQSEPETENGQATTTGKGDA
ncbi:hypothetical protein [Nonomuraea rhodomycinica]|uniref:Uncharacterized protein n=1 Tax=Nonomuraea rhodomycinica TaxID=1712872 RepID=A0A7Y6MEG5_9ACTN|nr:hypothetical protein [Nonomuraea rhodomycinica]NUW45543.1 hypothetical protein [Nonomuraea rhodomycinica]